MSDRFGLRALITKWLGPDNDWPAFVQVTLRDAADAEYCFIDKVPVVTIDDLTAESVFPVETWIAVDSVEDMGDATAVVDFALGGSNSTAASLDSASREINFAPRAHREMFGPEKDLRARGSPEP